MPLSLDGKGLESVDHKPGDLPIFAPNGLRGYGGVVPGALTMAAAFCNTHISA
jgi:hypothetical protein